ncbi:MAG: hypothetical protein CR971_01755 [candidate division SR1 bacterium]|nr:MAG: hypothetical protein CR971_01755 [candidate division SR1 bacterium]
MESKKKPTKKCHIIWQNYMRGFIEDNKIFFYLKEQNKIVSHGRRTKKGKEKLKISIGAENNLFNYRDEEKEECVDDLESSMGSNEELDFNNLLRGLEQEIHEIGVLSEKTMKTSRQKIFDMYLFALYKIFFSYVYKYLEIPEKKTKEQRDYIDILSKCFIHSMQNNYLGLTLNNVLQWFWLFIYIEEPVVYFGDFPFHLRPNRNNGTDDGNNLTTFLKRKGSNLYFPLNKNLFVIIENRGVNGIFFEKYSLNDLIIRDIETENKYKGYDIKPESLIKTIYDRIKSNSDKYRGGATRENIEKVIDRKIDKTKYWKDPIKFVLENQVKDILENCIKPCIAKYGYDIENLKKCFDKCE